ncbi:hypothetical protein [Aggregatibacter actinomycetemcomitans]|uniref:hypothetical protein n=1 Tax=Aggregatibacter actinomycetemcomitans TaxID=714 RepID=UPI00197BD811|nr:hypothetical protein [Aggregatibacter actinomycetemcomitans]MBN6063446.1 hypothetical protein [Aggregatibacter actinomycetemcomitans]MBN6080690.1 hypothetical protein [Aggregatibacter actinomycetemcomitans]MBN6083152.1 hypothetical protein [Aggregatibacter actinomycetemcomitans]
MTKLFNLIFKQQCVDLMLKQYHITAQVSKMMPVRTSAATPDSTASKRTARYPPITCHYCLTTGNRL